MVTKNVCIPYMRKNGNIVNQYSIIAKVSKYDRHNYHTITINILLY